MKVRVNGKEMSQSEFVTGMFLKPKKRAKPRRRKKARRRQDHGKKS